MYHQSPWIKFRGRFVLTVLLSGMIFAVGLFGMGGQTLSWAAPVQHPNLQTVPTRPPDEPPPPPPDSAPPAEPPASSSDHDHDGNTSAPPSEQPDNQNQNEPQPSHPNNRPAPSKTRSNQRQLLNKKVFRTKIRPNPLILIRKAKRKIFPLPCPRLT